jgi:hypothetical protein
MYTEAERQAARLKAQERFHLDYRRRQAQDRAAAAPPGRAVETYLKRLEARGEIVPGAADVILGKALGRNHQSLEVRPSLHAPNRPTFTPPRRIAATSADHLINVSAYLASDVGKIYRNPLHAPSEAEPELVAMARAVGLPKDEAEALYRERAAEFAGRSGGDLMSALAGDLVERAGGKYLGVDPARPTGAEAAGRPAEATGGPADPSRPRHHMGREYGPGELHTVFGGK